MAQEQELPYIVQAQKVLDPKSKHLKNHTMRPVFVFFQPGFRKRFIGKTVTAKFIDVLCSNQSVVILRMFVPVNTVIIDKENT